MNKMTKIVLFVSVAAIIAAILVWWEKPRNEAALLLERKTITQTAEEYLKAEKEGNWEKVYSFLAPSSVYRKTHTYQEFLKDAAGQAKKISTYQIVDIYRLRNNDGKNNFPLVEKFVQVEVDITFKDTGANSTFNYCFTFLKERGVWYKG